MERHPKWAEFMREQFPPGTRVRLAELKDSDGSLPSGIKGTIESVDGQCRLHVRWDGGQSALLMPGVDCFSVIPAPLETLKLYMPLTVRAYEKNRYGDWEEAPYELDGRQVLSYEDNIVSALLKERGREETERGLMTYYRRNDAVNRKVQSYVFTAEKVGGQLMGVAECRVRESLSDEEMEILKGTVSSQASDGFGKGVEQRPIKTADGEIYVSLWSSDKSWSIQTREELEQSRSDQGMRLE